MSYFMQNVPFYRGVSCQVLEPAKSKIVIPTGSALKALSLAADVCVPEHIRPQQAGGNDS
jgi:hypothetical protein